MSSGPRPIPRLRGLPVFGRLFDFRRDKLSLLLKVRDRCGDIGRYRLGPVTVTVVSSAELAQTVLVDQADAFVKSIALRTYMRPLFGEGLITSEGELHRRQRKLIGPVFVPARVGRFAELMVRETEAAAARLADGARVDLAQEMMRLSLVIIGQGLFGVDLSTEADVLSHSLLTVLRLASENAVSFAPFPPRWPTPRNLRLRAAVARLDKTIYRMIEERRRGSSGARDDFLAMLLAAQDEDDGSVMTDTQLRDEAITLFSAGHETSGSALSWSFYLLARHPSVYERLCAEADSVLGGRPPSLADVPRLPYALQVFKEAMRLYPPVYLVTRRAVRDVELGGHPITAGSIAPTARNENRSSVPPGASARSKVASASASPK